MVKNKWNETQQNTSKTEKEKEGERENCLLLIAQIDVWRDC